MNGIKHVFFDLDHTLWDFETNSRSTFELIFEKYQIPIAVDDFKTRYKPINEQYWKLYREDKITKEKLRYGRLTDAFKALNFELSEEMIHILSEEYIAYLSSFNTLFEGAIEILEYLNKKYKLHIITNGFNEVQHKKLENALLKPYFEQIITSELAGVKKPNPKIFYYAMKLANARAEESIMIGDNFEADILGAKHLGMQTIFCDFNGDVATEHVLSVSNLSEIKTFL